MRCGCTGQNFTSPDFASLLNIAHLHVRLARQAGERDGQLGATIPLTRRKPARLILMSCGNACPVIAGVTLPKVLLPMGSSSGLKGLPRTHALKATFGKYARPFTVS